MSPGNVVVICYFHVFPKGDFDSPRTAEPQNKLPRMLRVQIAADASSKKAFFPALASTNGHESQ